MMHSSFWWTTEIEHFIFYGYNVTTVVAFVATCFGSGALAFLFEWIKLLQTKQRQKEIFARAKQIRTICPIMENTSLLSKHKYMVHPVDVTLKSRIYMYTCDILLWFSLHNLGYLIMLVVMAYNFWFFLSVIVGGAIGYFFSGQSLMKVNLENCQVIKEAYCMINCSKPGSICNGETTPPILGASTSSAITCHHNIDTTVTVHNECEATSEDDR